MSDTKQDKLSDAQDKAVAESTEKAAETHSQMLTGVENAGGYTHVEGHGWTDEQLQEREDAEKREKEEAKVYAELAEKDRKRRGLPEPEEHKETPEEKKARELTEAQDAAVEAFNGGSGPQIVTGVLSTAPSTADVKKAREGTKTSRAQHTPVQGANDKHVPQDPSTKVLLHPDTPHVGPADPPKDLQERTGSLSNLLPRGQAAETSEDTGPEMDDLAGAPVKLERAETNLQDTNPQPEIKKDVEKLEADKVVVVPDEPTAEESSKPPSKTKSNS
jgi:hypothetical protein